MIRKYVSRQPIAMRDETTFAYELVWRTSSSSERITSQMQVQDFFQSFKLDFRPQALTSGKKAFIYTPHMALISELALTLSPSSFVFSFPETGKDDPELVNALQNLHKNRFELCFCDFTGKQDISPIWRFLTYIKVKYQKLTEKQHKDILYEWKQQKSKKVIADGIFSKEDFLQAKALGYEYFEGPFFSQPTLELTEDLGMNQNSVFQLLQELNKEDCDFDLVDQIINADAGLTYRILARGNTMAFASATKFTSATQVIVRMGLEELQRWATLTLLQEVSTPGQNQKLVHALLRASFLESLVEKTNPSFTEQDRYFIYLKGMFDIFPKSKQKEIFDTLDYVVNDKVQSESENLLALNHALELANYALVDMLVKSEGITEEFMMASYMDAVQKSNSIVF